MQGGLAAALLATSSFGAQAANINIAVASNFYNSGQAGSSAIADLIAAFQTANPGSTVTVVQNGATGTLESQITGGNGLGVDLFLAADTAHPQDLATNYSSLVVGSPFNYAVGTLVFWSNTPNVNVTCSSGGSCGYNSSTYHNVAIANPSTAPYGLAANTVLTGRYGLTAPLSTNPLVSEYSNIDTTLAAVKNQTATVGFVALSQICQNGSYPTSGSALVYPPTDTSVSPVIFNYNPIVQAGIRIARTRTTDQNTELDAFVAYLTDYTTLPPSQMITTLTNYCYSTP
ncbi:MULTISPECIES: molybdate ABC transporter substrate-binding protein [unclassified Bradyrhizobium]|uniref:molybdate ABC transporter substrate-binding protein n=1 Tax=unclassified Bradyrhizobium TaxID=2631580 RepID=UPI0028E57C1C|nr:MULTISPECIES: molybdate ABC transporter substrate-binding protein [unclassified Bradyrhizobium]